MRKLFFILSLFCYAFIANGQVLVSVNENNELGLSYEGTKLSQGTIIANTGDFICKTGAEDSYVPTDVYAIVNGEKLYGGLQGQTNPKDVDGELPSNSLKKPISGAFFVVEAKSDGWLYAIIKASSQKAYTVFEGEVAIAYTFAAEGDTNSKLGAVYEFTLDGKGEFNNEVQEPIESVEQEYLKRADPEFYASNWVELDGMKSWINLKYNGLGVIKFPVFKGIQYTLNANKSKLNLCGLLFDKTGDATIQTESGLTILGDGENVSFKGWTIYGDENLLGADWDETNSNNNMKALGDNKYSLVKNHIKLDKGSYEYKVARNQSLDEVYPESAAVLTISEDGTYNITFTFNEETKELNATAEICSETVNDYIDCDVKWNGSQSSAVGPWGGNYAAGVDAVISNFYSEAIKIVGMKVYEGDTMIGELTDYIGTTIDANSSFTVSFSVTSTIQMPSVLPWIELTYTCNDEEYSKKSTDRATATAISIIKTNRDNNNTIYSLEGKKLKTIPSHGLYILNGKKYIAK